MKFQCHGCGHCCKNLNAALASASALPIGSAIRAAAAAFPFAVLPDGSCSQLLATNQCAVYKNRPLICDVDKLFDTLDIPDLSREIWHELNAAACPPES